MSGMKIGAYASVLSLMMLGDGPAGITALAETNEQKSVGTLEQIIVTSRKRAESLQRVPLAVTAVSGEDLNHAFVNGLMDLEGRAPNVVIDSTIGFSSAASMSIRGISFQDIEKSFDPAIGVVVDGVFLATNAQALLDNFDLERVEILRGPQGTLFGKNTIGGTINAVRKKPSFDLSGEASYSYSSFDRHELKGALNLPIQAEKVAVRVAGNWKKSDGYLLNTANNEHLNGEDGLALRGAVLLTPSEEWEFYLNFDYIRDRGDSVGLRNATMPLQLFAFPGLLGLSPLFPGYPADTGPLKEVRNDYPNYTAQDTYGVSLEINWKQPDYTVTSITGYRWVDENINADLDAENAANFNTTRIQDHKQFTQELRFTSQWSERYDFVAGLYYFRSEYDAFQTLQLLTDWVPCGVLPGPFATLGCEQIGSSAQTTNSYAAYIQGNITLAQDLRLTVGGRYTYEKKDFFIAPLTFPAGGSGMTDGKKSWEEFTPRVGLDYQATANLFLFASYATGFKSGGFNGRAATVTSIGPYSPETVDAFEVGLKSEWLDRRVRFNATAFYNDYSDLQVEIVRAAVGGSGQETVVENAASATTYGLELEAIAIPVEGLQLSGNLGLLHAKYDDFDADLGMGLGVTNNSHLKLRRAPKVVFGLGAVYEHAVGNYGSLIFNANYRWQDDLHTTTQNFDIGHRREVGILDGSITFENIDRTWTISVFGRNLTDEFYISDGIAIGELASLQSLSMPRQWGVRLDVRF